MPLPTYRNLVFEGGGVWGIAYEGALAELESTGVLKYVERVAGASAGAITASLLAVGHNPKSLGKLMRATNFEKFQDDSFGVARDVARLLREYGWHKGEQFRKWMRKALRKQVRTVSEKAGVPALGADFTFGELESWQNQVEDASGVSLPRLYLVGTNLTKQRRETYSHRDSAGLPVVEAVRRSMSIPLFFACARGSDNDVIVDGGLTWNYPVDIFDHTDFVSPAKSQPISYAKSESHVYNPETLGFRLDTTKEIEFNLKDWANAPVEVDDILGYSWALVTFIRAIANKAHLHKNDWVRTIFIDVGDEIRFTDFDLKEHQKDFLSKRGGKGVRDYFEWRSSQKGEAEVQDIYVGMD